VSPYIAVIKDSFRSALASRVLWVAIAAIWFVLLALSLSGYRENLTAEFAGFDFHNPKSLKAMLAEGLVVPEKKETPLGRLAAAMPEELQRDLKRVGEGEELNIAFSDLTEGLNSLLDKRDWYDEGAWSKVPQSAESRQLAQLGDQASEAQSRRLARLRIEAATPGVFGPRPAISIRPTYAGFDFPVDLPMDKRQFNSLINQFIFPFIISWLLGFVLIFLGIVVTSPIIPGMLQPGSLHLLLSKPISRSGLLISKFLGGCSFMLLCVTQLVIGLYLVAGFRLDIWNVRLLWCIPASVLLFSVFYSVSVLAGLVFRSEVLSIGITCIFGGICMVTGFIGGLFDGFVRDPDKIVALTASGDEILSNTVGGELKYFDQQSNRWMPIFEKQQMRADRVLRPVVIQLDNQERPLIATARVKLGGFNPFGTGPTDLLVLDPNDQWSPQPSIRLPAATTSLYKIGNDHIAALNTMDLSIIDTKVVASELASRVGKKKGPDSRPAESPLAKLSQMMGRASGPFQSILPSGVSVAQPRQLSFDDEGKQIWIGSGNSLWRLEQDPASSTSPWTVGAKAELAGQGSTRFQMALGSRLGMVARDEEPATIFDRQTLKTVAQVEKQESKMVTHVVALTDDRFLTAWSDGKLMLHEIRGSEVATQTMPINQVESIAIHPQDQSVLVAHHIDRVSVLDGKSLEARMSIRPSLSSWRWLDQFVVSPLRFMVPQTGELGNVVASLISGKSAVLVGDPSSETTPIYRYEFLRPLLSCGGFIVVMMLINLVYFRTRDF
jgi:ABC-2 family transporter protein